MIRKKAMAKKHIQISKACVKKAKRSKRSERRKFWLDMAKKQVNAAENYIEHMS